jgi:hypothetical protein
MSLVNHAAFLADLERITDGLALVEEAVRIYRDLAAARPSVFLGPLSMALNNLPTYLGAVGRQEEALPRSRKPSQSAASSLRNGQMQSCRIWRCRCAITRGGSRSWGGRRRP